MASPLVQFRATGLLANEVEQRSEPGKPTSEVGRRDLERYYFMLKRSLPTFTENDAMLMVDAMNGTITEPHTAHLLWANVDDAIKFDGLDKKWNVDGPALIERLRGLTPFECLAVADAIERAWNDETYRINNMQERIRKVGLVRMEQKMQYDSRSSNYKGVTSEGRILVVDGDEFAEALQQAERDGVNTDEIYSVSTWEELIGSNDSVQYES